MRELILTLEQRIRELEAAIMPFAQYGKQMRPDWQKRNLDSVYYGVKREGAHQIKYRDFFRAEEVMRGKL